MSSETHHDTKSSAISCLKPSSLSEGEMRAPLEPTEENMQHSLSEAKALLQRPLLNKLPVSIELTGTDGAPARNTSLPGTNQVIVEIA